MQILCPCPIVRGHSKCTPKAIEHGLVGVLVLSKLNKMNGQGKAYRITPKAFGIEHGLVDQAEQDPDNS